MFDQSRNFVNQAVHSFDTLFYQGMLLREYDDGKTGTQKLSNLKFKRQKVSGSFSLRKKRGKDFNYDRIL